MKKKSIIILQKVKATEKVIRMLEVENTMVFETDRKFKKSQIKKEVEELFNIKVKSVNTHNIRNKKLVYVKLKPEYQAIDIATKLGMM